MRDRKIEWAAFQRSHVEAAAKLTSAFKTAEQAERAIEGVWERENVSGIAAFRDSELVGYLIGRLETDKARGRHTWVDYAGAAIAAGESSELYREMYAAIASDWVANGSFRHYVLVPSGDEAAVDGWLRLGFAYEQVHAVQTIPAVQLPEFADPAVRIRLAGPEDEPAVRKISTLIMEHQAGAPVWAPAFGEDRAKFQEGYVQLIKDPSAYFWVAAREEEILGFQAFYPPDNLDIDRMFPGSCICLGVGATVPEARGQGIGAALVKHGLDRARREGFTNCIADWRMTNVEASRFWPKQGFTPYAYRLVRYVDPRIAWADGKA
ncbi:GNAT family N-acetyltransferase [Cohnella caldifontis]|uniref:GNAT family N-acetyltransferase n=1 Tax=Cohnella caldifontis TaxID=3027471 RepID=UPI0023EC8CD7|nr:GNAT family N-acetyltransferase [Cohnella sp. YIM B05605]